MKRKVLVESTIETDATGKYCLGKCEHKIYSDYCTFFNAQLGGEILGDYWETKRCAKCIKAEVVKP